VSSIGCSVDSFHQPQILLDRELVFGKECSLGERCNLVEHMHMDSILCLRISKLVEALQVSGTKDVRELQN
jgi:hypothetical protein